VAVKSLPLSADVPLNDPSKEDELGRSAFSERIAQLIVDSAGVAPPVLGIVGEWGSGKTTVLNFVEWHLLRLRPGTATLRFNAWRHASGGRGAIQAALVEQVAARILGRLGRAQEKVKKALRAYGSGALQAGELAGTPIPGVKTAASVGASALVPRQATFARFTSSRSALSWALRLRQMM
jgi:KAP family P-loop domain